MKASDRRLGEDPRLPPPKPRAVETPKLGPRSLREPEPLPPRLVLTPRDGPDLPPRPWALAERPSARISMPLIAAMIQRLRIIVLLFRRKLIKLTPRWTRFCASYEDEGKIRAFPSRNPSHASSTSRRSSDRSSCMRFPRNYLEKISVLDSVYVSKSRSASLWTGSSSVICSNVVPLGSDTTRHVSRLRRPRWARRVRKLCTGNPVAV